MNHSIYSTFNHINTKSHLLPNFHCGRAFTTGLKLSAIRNKQAMLCDTILRKNERGHWYWTAGMAPLIHLIHESGMSISALWFRTKSKIIFSGWKALSRIFSFGTEPLRNGCFDLRATLLLISSAMKEICCKLISKHQKFLCKWGRLFWHVRSTTTVVNST